MEEIGIINVNVCPPVCWSVEPSWIIPEPEVDLCSLNNNKKIEIKIKINKELVTLE